MFKYIWIMGHVALRLNNNIVIIGGVDYKHVGKSDIPMNEIFMYNLYTERWRKCDIPGDKLPTPRCSTCAAVIGKDIYMFGGYQYFTSTRFNDLWKLTSITEGGFSWRKIEFQREVKLPACRNDHCAWEYEDCMWVFGGKVDLQGHSEWLNSHGETSPDGSTNQLLRYDPSTQWWTNPQSFGTVPSPRAQHSTALIGDKLWLFSGCTGVGRNIIDNCFFQLDIKSHTWTQTLINNKIPNPYSFCCLVAISNTQLVLHMCIDLTPPEKNDTWIIDLSSSTWKHYTIRDERRTYQTCSAGVNKCAVIGGAQDFIEPQQASKVIFEVMLEPKSLQQLAMKIIYNEQDVLPWMCLPPKLIVQLDLTP